MYVDSKKKIVKCMPLHRIRGGKIGRVGQNHAYTVYIQHFLAGRSPNVHGVYIRFWPTLKISDCIRGCIFICK